MADQMLTYDQGAVAQSYAQLTAVLSGFSFSGLTFLLTLPRETDDGSHGQMGDEGRFGAGKAELTRSELLDRAAVLTFASFVGLALSSLTYSIITGEKSNDVAANAHVIAGCGFSISAQTLMLAVLYMVRARGIRLGRLGTSMVGFGIPLAGVVYVALGLALALPGATEDRSVQLTFIGAVILTVIVSVVHLFSSVGRPGGWVSSRKSYRLVAALGSITPLVAATIVGVLINPDPGPTPPSVIPPIASAIITLIISAMIGAITIADPWNES